jgi:hypothetical protein
MSYTTEWLLLQDEDRGHHDDYDDYNEADYERWLYQQFAYWYAAMCYRRTRRAFLNSPPF